MLKRTLIILAVTGLLFSGSKLVLAQDATAPAVTAVDTTAEAPSLSAELRRLKTQYRGELEEYRRLESQYMISKRQYAQLKTLTSLETGVHDTQAAMEARARVLMTYLQILKVSLMDQTGIELEQKQATLEALTATSAKVDRYHQSLMTEMDKVTLQKASVEFETLGAEVEQVSYQALAQLVVGKLQSVYDKTSTVADDMRTVLATQGGALKQGQRQRGFDETERTLGEVKSQLEVLNIANNGQQASQSKSDYAGMQDDLGKIYSQLSQAINFLKELVNL